LMNWLDITSQNDDERAASWTISYSRDANAMHVIFESKSSTLCMMPRHKHRQLTEHHHDLQPVMPGW
jgi:hypothetical protein